MAAIIVDANSAVVTAGAEDAPASGTVETLTVTTLVGEDWPVLSGGEWFHAIDAADKGKTSNYEVIRITATANGTGVSWTATRGDGPNGTTHAHAAGWTILPVLSAESLGSAIAADSVPIANPTGITTGTETPDPISGANTARWVEFPLFDASVMAWGLAGDSFPRVVFAADPNNIGALLLGDGTFDPTSDPSHAVVSAFSDPDRGWSPNIGANFFGAVLGVLGFTGMDQTNGPQGVIGGQVGDLAVNSKTNALDAPNIWRCTTAGNPSTAVWSLVSVLAATDPITDGVTPPNAGAIWQDTSGTGSLWVSTGASLGDWLQLLGGGVVFPPAHAGAPTYVKGGMYFDTTLNKLRIGGATAWETVTSA